MDSHSNDDSRQDVISLALAETGSLPGVSRILANLIMAPFFAIGWVGGMSWWALTMMARSLSAGWRRGMAPKFTQT